MSVTCVLYAAHDREILQLLADPDGIHDFLSRANPVSEPGCFGALMGKRRMPLPSPRASYDLEKPWEAVHYQLSGTKREVPLPSGFILGGELVGDEDVGYGPARAITSRDVTDISDLLSSVSVEDFRKRIDLHKMQVDGVYGAPFTPDDVDYLVSVFAGLREFIKQRSDAGEGLLVQFV